MLLQIWCKAFISCIKVGMDIYKDACGLNVFTSGKSTALGKLKVFMSFLGKKEKNSGITAFMKESKIIKNKK